MTRLSDNWRDWPPQAKVKFLERLQAIPDIRPVYSPRGAAADLQSSTQREIILTGPARTGKSLACLFKLYRLAIENPGLRALVVRHVRADLSESGLVTLERDVLGNDSSLVLDGPRRQWRHTYRLPNGSLLVLGGLDKPGKMLSTEYDLIYVQQAEEIAETDWETLITRLSGRVLPQEQQQIIGDCNPASPAHWIMQRSLQGHLALWQTYHRDNPLLWNGDAETGTWTDYGKEYIEKLSLLTGTLRERLLEGKWSQAEGLVYPEFSVENITEDEPDAEQVIEIAADDGYVDARAILFIQRTATRILVFDEIYHTRHLAEKCVGEVVERCNKNKWKRPEIAIGGPESKELAERFRRADIPYRSRPHEIVEGIAIVRSLISDGNGYRTLQVNRRCKNLIRELTEGYRYPEGSRRDNEKPLDGNDHSCDSLRYWAFLRAR